MIISNGDNRYDLAAKPVAAAPSYRLYICHDVATGRQYLLQAAADGAANGNLERAAFVLRGLKRTSDLFEAEYAKQGSKRRLDYDRLFPGVVDSFLLPTADGRQRINVLSVKEVDDLTDLVPLSNISTVDGVRVGLPSSAWIMGRLLKLLEFSHGEGIAVRLLSGNNVLIHPERHFVVVLDWSAAVSYQKEVPIDVRKDDIEKAARAVFEAIGGDPQLGQYPYEAGDAVSYVSFIWRLASHRESDAGKAHTQFYELVEQLFGREFRPFEVLPR